MDKTTPIKSKPLVNTTCKLGTKGCFDDGRCHALGNCENKITTNADRIRAMGDAELAEYFSELIRDTKKQEYCTGVGDWLQWLQSEVE